MDATRVYSTINMPTQQKAQSQTFRPLIICFFLSGAASLVLEVAWAKQLSYLLGNTLYGVATVVAAFMGGLAIGSGLIARFGHRLQRPLRAYGVMELAIAVSAILSIPIFKGTEPLFAALYRGLDPGHGAFLLLRFLVVFGLMVFPVMLMGMTLPVLVGAVARGRRSYSRETGILYGVNTLGAVVGTLGAGYVLIPFLGIIWSTVFAGVTDLMIAGIALTLDRRAGSVLPAQPAAERNPAVAPKTAPSWTSTQWLTGAVFGLSGAVAMVYEVGWFRLLGLTMGPSVYAFSAMLAIYLVGIGLGSVITSRWVERTRLNGLVAFAILEGLLGLVGLLDLYFANQLPIVHARLLRSFLPVGGGLSLSLTQLLTASLLVLPPTLLMGAILPFAVRAIRETGRSAAAAPESTIGRLYVLNTGGGILGSLLGGFFLVPGLGAWRVLSAAGMASLVLGAVLALAAFSGRRRRAATYAIASLALGVLMIVGAPPWNAALFSQGLYRAVWQGSSERLDVSLPAENLIFYREGVNTQVAVFRGYGNATLHVGGKSDASTTLLDCKAQLMIGHIPMLFAKDPRRALVIGYGSGMTTAAILLHPELERVEVVEIEKGVIEASPYFESINDNPFDDPRTHLILEDGRIRLTYTNEKYDVISSEPSNPWMAGISNLFTEDFYRTARNRLAPGGVFAQWVQNYSMSEEAFRTILASIRDVFPHVVVFQTNPWDLLLLASPDPLTVSWERLTERFRQPEIQASFRRIEIGDPIELAFFLMAAEPQVASFVEGTRTRNTDDNVWLEHRMPLEVFRRTSGGESLENPGTALFRQSAPHRLEGLSAMIPGLPLEDAVRAMVRYPHAVEPDPSLLQNMGMADPWMHLRSIQIQGIEAGLREIGRTDLADSALAWDRKWDLYRKARIQATATIVRSLRPDGTVEPKALEQALAAAPDLPLAVLFQGTTRLSNGDYDGAAQAFRSALDHPYSGSYYDALVGLSKIAEAQGNVVEAISLIETACRVNPYHTKAHVEHARILLQQGDTAGAKRVLDYFLRYHPSYAERVETMLRQVPP